ncbi:uncharacterized protein [Atheta coriaria]|uniref:uncharacterized protein isoform X2 n=1 Tax=Dalotia coriaria TaxID=877792 RepID=UPI0031F47038
MDENIISMLRRDLNIDFQRYRKNPTEHETISIFTYLINIIRRSDPDTPRTVPQIYRDVNYLLGKLNSSVKVCFAELLEPTQATVMAVSILSMHVSKQNFLLTGVHPNFLSKIDRVQEKINLLKESEEELRQLKEELSANDDIHTLKHLALEEDALILQDKRNLETEQEKLENKLTTLKYKQDKNSLLEVQIQGVKAELDTFEKFYEKETQQHKVISSYESKAWQVEALNEEIKKLESVSNTAPFPVGLDTQIITTLQKLSENITHTLDAFAENDELSGACFEIQKKITNLLKQIDEVHARKEDHMNDNSNIKDLDLALKESNCKKADLLKCKKGVYNLYCEKLALDEKIKKLEEIQDENEATLHTISECCSKTWENNGKHYT